MPTTSEDMRFDNKKDWHLKKRNFLMNFPTTVSIIIVTLTSRVILENIKRSNTHNSVTVYNKESDFNDFNTILVLILVLKSYVYSQNINLHLGTKK